MSMTSNRYRCLKLIHSLPMLELISASQVNKLRDQCQKQEETIKEQEGELNSRKEELQKLKEEEHSLEKEYDSSLKEKEKISVQLQDTQLQISQVRAMVTQLEEVQHQMTDALALCKIAVEENNASIISDYSLNIEPEFRDFKKALLSPEEKAKEGELIFSPSTLLAPTKLFPSKILMIRNRRSTIHLNHHRRHPPHLKTVSITKPPVLVTTIHGTEEIHGTHTQRIPSAEATSRIPLQQPTMHLLKM